jgi:hypothetical protein
MGSRAAFALGWKTDVEEAVFRHSRKPRRSI